MKIKNIHKLIVASVLIIGVNVYLWNEGVKNNPQFTNITLMSLLSLDVSVIVSVYLVQNLISKRRRYDFMAKLLDTILADLGKSVLLDHGKHNEASLLQRYISNRLLFISKAVPRSINSEMEYVTQAFDRIQTFYGDHGDAMSNDVYYEREKINISIKVAKIQLVLYGFDISD